MVAPPLRCALRFASLLTLALYANGCAVDQATKIQEQRQPVDEDQVVRERVIARMKEISAPTRGLLKKTLDAVRRGHCEKVCTHSGEICGLAARVCDLAADYPKDDTDVADQCRWPQSDCDESRAACANCGGNSRERVY